jgi:hypothetical protein
MVDNDFDNSDSDVTGATCTGRGSWEYPHPWVCPAPISFETETLAQNLITGKGLAYTESLMRMMDDIEGKDTDK